MNILPKLLVEFSDYLRTNGITVPTSSIEDAVKALPYIRCENRHEFQETLKQLWIKDKEEIEKYDIAFQEFFYQQAFRKAQDWQLAENIQDIHHTLEELRVNQREKENRENRNPMTHPLSELLAGKPDSPVKTFFEMSANNQISHGLENIKELVPAITEKDINDLAEELTWDAIINESPSIVFDAISQHHLDVLNLHKEVLKIKTKELHALSLHEKDVHKGMRKMIRTEVDSLLETSVTSLSAKDLHLLRETIERTSVHLLTKFSKLLKQANQESEIDMNRTMSESMRTFGIPMELYYRSRKKKKTKIDILLDISGSVKKSAEFLILFAYLIHAKFPGQVRVFPFVGLLDETTALLQTSDIDDAIEKTMTTAAVDYRGYSDYGKALSIYEDAHMGQVDRDTLVFVLGDARNNRNEAREDILRTLFQRSKGVFWINPEERVKWGQGDSAIETYQPYCSGVYEANTVRKLLEALDAIVQHSLTDSKVLI